MSSCEPVPPETPIAPMILPPTTIGLPPRDPTKASPSVGRYELNWLLPISRSNTSVGRRKRAAAFALPCEIVIEAYWQSSIFSK